MKFQNPSLNFFLNGRKDGWTNKRTHKPKPICSPLFQSWGHKKLGGGGVRVDVNSEQRNEAFVKIQKKKKKKNFFFFWGGGWGGGGGGGGVRVDVKGEAKFL